MAPARDTARYSSRDMVIPSRTEPAALSSRFEQYARAMGFGQLDREDLTETMRYY